MGGRPVTVRIARWSAEHPWRAVALWIVFVAVCFVGGSAAGINKATAEDQAIGEAGRAGTIVSAGQFDDPAVENVLITARGGTLDVRAAGAVAADAAARLGGVAGVARVGDPQPARLGGVAAHHPGR
jgi:RND superfamily putative drug exporter